MASPFDFDRFRRMRPGRRGQAATRPVAAPEPEPEPSTLLDGMVSAFQFEESGTPYSDELGGSDWVDADAPPVSGAGKHNLGLSTSFVEGGINNSSSPDGDFTTSFWFKMPAPLVPDTQFFVHVDSTASAGVLVTLTAGDVINFFDGSSNFLGTIPVVAGVYHNLVHVYDQATQTHSIYLDGVLDQTFVSAFTTGNPETIQLGLQDGGPGMHWDEFYAWNRKTNAGEIADLQTEFYPFP